MPAASAASRSDTPEPALVQRLDDPDQVTVGFGGGDEQRGAHVGLEPLEEEVDDALPGPPDRQRVGELGATGTLVGVEQVGRLDEHERDPAAGRDELAADGGAGDPGVEQDLVGDVLGHGVDAQRRAGVGVRVGTDPPGRHDRQPLELQPAGDVRQRAPGRQVDPRQVVDEDDDRGALGGVDQQVTRGEGDGERLDRLVGRLDGEGGEDRRPPGRRQPLDAVQRVAVEQPGEPRPGELDLGLDPAQAEDPALRLVRLDQRAGFVEHRRLADPRLADDGDRAALTDGRARGKGDDGVDNVLATS